MTTVTAKKNKFADIKKLLTGQGALNEIKDEFYWTLFRRLKSRAQTGLTRKSLHRLRTAMQHHSKNDFSLFSCLVLSSFVFSSLLFSRSSSVFSPLPVPVFFLCLCLSLSLSPCGVVCRDVLCFVDVVCVVCVNVCVLVCDTLRNSVCPLNTSPCVRSKRPRVSRHHAHTCFNTCARGAGTNGEVLNVHTGTFFSSVKQVIIDISWAS